MVPSSQLAPVYKPGGAKELREIDDVSPDATSRLQLVSGTPAYITKTVYGFLDYKTTVGNTVMVFTPKSKEPSKLYFFI